MKLSILFLLACGLWAQDAKVAPDSKPPTVEELQAKIVEQAKIIADQAKVMQAWYNKYSQCDMQLSLIHI